MRISFSHPLILLLLPIIIGLLIFSMRYLHARSRDIRIKQVILRCLVFSLLILSLSGVNIMKKDNLVATVFIVDASDSAKESRDMMTAFLRDALTQKSKNDYVGIVSMGRTSSVEHLLSDSVSFNGIQAQVDASASDLEASVNLALTLMPEGYAKRIVLMTDGRETKGNLTDTAAVLTKNGCELKILELPPFSSDEVYIKNVTIPKQVGSGENFNIRVDVESNVETAAKVYLYNGKQLSKETNVFLTKGSNTLTFTDTQNEADSISTYRVRVEPVNDTFSLNNEYAAFTHISASKTILILEKAPGEAANLSSLFKSLGYDTFVSRPENAPSSISELLGYSTVILVNTPYSALPEGFINCLDTYVNVHGKSLIACGGREAFGPGGYEETVLEKMLPVDMEVKGEFEQPTSGIEFVLDRSGSMGSATEYGSKLNAAKAATIEAIKILREKDYAGVMFFDTEIMEIMPQSHPTNKDDIINKISSVPGGGGTSIYPAVQAAIQAVIKSPAASRHILLLTDGEDFQTGYEPLIELMNKNGITLSTVAIGVDCNTELLKMLADSCGGRMYLSLTGQDLPKIFTEEVFLTQNSYIIDEPCYPSLTSYDQITKNVFDNGMPELLAYIGTTAKNDARVLLSSHRDDPILAYRQYGLGKTFVWTSDVTGNWSKNFFEYPENQLLWSNIIHSATESSIISGSYTEATADGDIGVLKYHIGNDNYSENTKVYAYITDENGSSSKIPMLQRAPGEFFGDFDLGAPGVYTIAVQQYEGESYVGSAPPTAAVRKYSDEYIFTDNITLLTDYAGLTGGQFITEASQVFEDSITLVKRMKDQSMLLLLLALLLFVFDIAYRRFRFRILPENFWNKLFTSLSLKAKKEVKNSLSPVTESASEVSPASSKGGDEAGEKDKAPTSESGKKKEEKDKGKGSKNKKQPELLDTSQLLGRMKK